MNLISRNSKWVLSIKSPSSSLRHCSNLVKERNFTGMNYSRTLFKGALIAMVVGFVAAQTGKADTIISLSGVLDGAQDNVSTTWSGTETATLNETTNLFSWNVSFSYSDTALYGIPDMAHFHFGAPGVNGPIVIPLADTSMMNPVTPIPTSLIGSQTVTASQASEIAAGDWYANVHSTVHPAGIIRGQLNPTPEPASLLLLAGGLGILGVVKFRRLRNA